MTPPIEPPRGPYSVHQRRQTVPGTPRDQLTGPTPLPPTQSSGAHLERAVPPGVDRATAAWLEGVLVEQTAMLAASLEKTHSLKVESKALAELSGKLLKAEETVTDEGRRANRNRAIAWGNAGALLAAITIFVVKWTAYRDTAEVASKAAAATATEVVEQKAVPLDVKATTSDIRLTALEEQNKVFDTRLSGMEDMLRSIQQAVEPATQVRVPQQHRRAR